MSALAVSPLVAMTETGPRDIWDLLTSYRGLPNELETLPVDDCRRRALLVEVL